MLRNSADAFGVLKSLAAGVPQPARRITLARLMDAVGLVRLWMERGRQRRSLANLDDRQLRDLGLTRADVRLECAKPIWLP